MDAITKTELVAEALDSLKWKTIYELRNSVVNTVESLVKNASDPLPGITKLSTVINQEVSKIYNINLLLDEFGIKDDIS